MDGVLVSSIGSVNRCWRRWAAHYGVPKRKAMRSRTACAPSTSCAGLKPDVDMVEGLRVIEDMEIADVEDLKVLPGVRELLESCRRSAGPS